MKVIFRQIYFFLSILTALVLLMEVSLLIDDRETIASEIHAVTNDAQPHEEEREHTSEFLHNKGLTINGLYPPVRISLYFPSFSTSYTIDIPYPPPEG